MVELAPARQLGKYELERRLGKGGMGEVWAARDPDLDRRVALKVLHAHVADAGDARARFQREGRAMARLRHPNVIVVHDATFSDGRGVIAMEIIDGENLAMWATRTRSPSEIVRVALAAGRGLVAAHEAGVIHRDFKPHNVLIGRDGRVVVTDFGLARAFDEADPAPVPPRGVPALAAGTDSTITPESGDASTMTPAPGERPPVSGDAARIRPPVSGDAATMTPPVSGEGATMTPPVSGEGATMTPPVSGEGATMTPVSGEGATMTPPVSGEGATMTPTVASAAPRPSRGELASQLTETGALLGTPAYMAPEQLAGQSVDMRADQFAYCVSVWELFAGERPFRGATLDELAEAIARGELAASAKIPRRLRAILARGLAADPARRWPTMQRLLVAIERSWQRPRRLALAGGASAVALAAVVGVLGLPSRSERAAGALAASTCGDPDAEIASVWSPAVRADIAKLLAGRDSQQRVLRIFDQWAATWRSIYTANCAKPADPDFAPRRVCLEGTRDELALIMQRRATLPAEMWEAPDMARLVVMPDACLTDPRNLMPAPPPATVRDEVTQIRIELATARVPLITHSLTALAVDVTPQLERARKTGYVPVVIEARLMDTIVKAIHADDGERGPTCAAFAAVAREAELAGYERMMVEALVLQHACEDADDSPNAERTLEHLQTITQRSRNPVQFAEVQFQLCQNARLVGMFDDALAFCAAAHEIYDRFAIDDYRSMILSEEARIRLGRHRGDDLVRALELARASAAIRAVSNRRVPVIAKLIRELEWQLGKPIAPPPVAADGDAIAIELHVVGAGAGVRVGAALGLYADATREAMFELGGAATGVTDESGVLRIDVPRGAVILARAGDQIGTAIAAHPGVVALRLSPSASITGTATVPQGGNPRGRDDYDGQAAKRWPAKVFLVDGDRPIVWAAPVAADGTWRLPAIAPGRYRVVLQAQTGLIAEARQVTVDVRAGATTAPPLALAEHPGVLALVLRPGSPGTAIAMHGTRVPTTWPELRAQLAAADHVSVGTLSPWADPAARFGDRIARVSTAGDTVVCVVESEVHTKVPITVWDARGKPPLCRGVPAGARNVTITR